MEQPIAETEGRSFDGGCHCGAIRFCVRDPLRQILMCHCSDCLKNQRNKLGRERRPCRKPRLAD